MIAGFVILFGYVALCWAVFFKFKWMKFNIAWGVVTVLVGVHLLLIFVIGLRFVAPYAAEAKVIQHTIQLIPRLPEPTRVTAVLVEPNVPVKKGQPLFQFDRRPYEYKVRQLEAELAGARQDVLVLKAELDAAEYQAKDAKAALDRAEADLADFRRAGRAVAGIRVENLQQAALEAQASLDQAKAAAEQARLKYESQIGGVNTKVASVDAELALARYYLDNTTMVAPEDGYVFNLQVRPGMVSGIVRFGAIASFVVDADRYVLATFFQENLKYVKKGQPVELAMDLYPGQIFPGTVQAIWRGSGAGQLLPSGTMPDWQAVPWNVPQGQFAVAIHIDDPDQSKFPIGTQGRATIYTNPKSGFVILRKIGIRGYSWFNWIYPFSG
jgi:multidrug resistance efflux pump